MLMEKTKHYSWKTGKLAEGCRLCVKGEKMVLFVTGECPRHCFYCPLSDARKDIDVIYANEWKLENEKDVKTLIKEAELTGAKGAGITGGDPLVKVDRTADYIRLLKKRFGKKFHVHLYTILQTVTEEKLKKLHDAGLDEIRFHPDFNNTKDWQKIGLVRKYDWKIGVEIPAIPKMEKQTTALIDYFKDKIDFLNLNELEIAENNAKLFEKMGYYPKDSSGYNIEGSEELAKKLMKKYGKEVNIHFCTAKLKEKVQVGNRIIRRAKNVARDFDEITEDGLLVRGVLYLDEFTPGFGYRKKLESLGKEKGNLVSKLEKKREELIKKYSIPKNMIEVDDVKVRLLTSKKIVRNISKKKEKGLNPAIVIEYPTADSMEIEIDFLG